jgi:hypothetical protein
LVAGKGHGWLRPGAPSRLFHLFIASINHRDAGVLDNDVVVVHPTAAVRNRSRGLDRDRRAIVLRERSHTDIVNSGRSGLRQVVGVVLRVRASADHFSPDMEFPDLADRQGLVNDCDGPEVQLDLLRVRVVGDRAVYVDDNTPAVCQEDVGGHGVGLKIVFPRTDVPYCGREDT